MTVELPYLSSYKNVPALFQKIADAKIPDAFTHKFLQDTIGLKGTADRQLISLLRTMEFLDGSGKPTSQYALLKNSKTAPIAIASAIRKAYAPLFDANENANEAVADVLRGLISQVAGTDSGMTAKIAGTFNSLVKLGDFKASLDNPVNADKKPPPLVENKTPPVVELPPSGSTVGFHYNIQIHLPSNGTEETYLNIFNAVRKVFK